VTQNPSSRLLPFLLRSIGWLPRSWRAGLRRSSLYPLSRALLGRLGRRAGAGLYRIQGGPLAGYQIDTDPSQVRAYIFGDYEPVVTNAIETHCRPGMQVADIGAHHGYFTLLMARLIGSQGRCHSFEASARNADRIARSVAANALTQVSLHRVAASDTRGTVRFSYHGDALLMGRLDSLIPSVDQIKFSGHEDVAALPIDDLALERLDMAKIDVEGAELAVLRGMAETLARCRPILIIEVHSFAPPEDLALPLLQSLHGMGYRLRDLPTQRELMPDHPFTGHLLALPGSSI